MEQDSRSVRFGVYDLDLTTGELRKSGLKIRLPHQSFQILARLLEHPGEVASRDALRRILWPDDTFVDFDVGLSSAVKKLRDALGDSAENPRFIETLPRLGYRFIAPVHNAAQGVESAPSADVLPVVETPTWRSVIGAYVARWQPLVVVLAAVALVGLVLTTGRALSSARYGLHTPLTRAVSPSANELLDKANVAAGRLDFEQATRYAEAAVAIQPDFVRAYARLALWYNQFAFAGGRSPLDFMSKAEAAARKAIALDDEAYEPHAQLGLVLYRSRWDWSGAEREFRRSLELNGRYAEGHRMLGVFLSATGRSKEAVAEAQLGRDLDPLSATALLNLGTVHREAGQNEQAILEFREVAGGKPDSALARLDLGVSYLIQRDWKAAVSELGSALTLSHRNPRTLAWLGYAYAISGKTTDAQDILIELQALSRQQFISPVDIAGIQIALGQREAAFASLDQACEKRDHKVTTLLVDSRMDALRADPRFQALLRRVGLVR